MRIRGLGYLGLQGPDPAAWLAFATGVCGLMPARAVPGEPWGPPGSAPPSGGSGLAPDGSAYLKMDEWQWRIAVHPDERAGLRYLGLEVAGPGELEQAARELADAGIAVEHASEGDVAARAVHDLIAVTDPAGNRVEIFHGVTRDGHFASPAGVSRFVTGSLGMGHVVLLVPDVAKARAFYCDLLGFRLSDYVEFGPDQGLWFLHCNARHHSVALCRVGDFAGLHHLLLETAEVDDVGRAHDRARAAGCAITSTLGRHVNDRMFSFYVRSPLGFEVEIGTGGLQIDEHWTPARFVEGDVWGHEGLTAESLESAAATGGD